MEVTELPGIAYEIDAARERVTLTIGTERLSMNAVELERLVQFLGVMRGSMQPEVEADVPTSPFPVIDTPRVAVQLTKDETRAGILVRTRIFGWIGCNLDRLQTAELGRHLTEIAALVRTAGH